MSLYDRITELHGTSPWGSVLDAGTGRGSMRWLLSLPTERWTAITGSAQMAENLFAISIHATPRLAPLGARKSEGAYVDTRPSDDAVPGGARPAQRVVAPAAMWPCVEIVNRF